MIDREDAERMLNLAKVDLKAIRNMLDPEIFEDSVFGLHAQQAVERALKSWLTLRGIAYPKTHDLRLLMSLLESHGQEDCRRFESLVYLTDFAVQFRYDYRPATAEVNRPAVLGAVEDLIRHPERVMETADATG